MKKTKRIPQTVMSKYRPIKTYSELCECLGTSYRIRGTFIFFRNKRTHCCFYESVVSFAFDVNGGLHDMNDINVEDLFLNYECFVNGVWKPFGIKVE